jgi:hypothetical protein
MRLKMWAKSVCAIIILLTLYAALIFAPAFAPVPGQSAKSSAQTADNGKQETTKDHDPCPSLSPINREKESLTNQPHRADQAKKDECQQVAVVSLPVVSVASDYKGWVKRLYDWGPWAFAFLLVIVGGLQVWLLRQTRDEIKRQANTMQEQAEDARASVAAAALVAQETLAAIKRQADSMGTQAGHMENQARFLGDSVAETRRSVNAAIEQLMMVKDKERARLEIDIEKFNYNTATKHFFTQKVRWQIRLHGQSEAFVITSRMIGCIGEPDQEVLQRSGHQMGIRDVVAPYDRFAHGECFIAPLSVSGEDVGNFNLDSLKERKGILWCMGAIVFKDVFGDFWLLRFKRKWDYDLFGSDEIDGDGWGGEWIREGEEGDNEERAVKINPKVKKPN